MGTLVNITRNNCVLFDGAGCFRRDTLEAVVEKGDPLNRLWYLVRCWLSQKALIPKPFTRIPGCLSAGRTVLLTEFLPGLN